MSVGGTKCKIEFLAGDLYFADVIEIDRQKALVLQIFQPLVEIRFRGAGDQEHTRIAGQHRVGGTSGRDIVAHQKFLRFAALVRGGYFDHRLRQTIRFHIRRFFFNHAISFDRRNGIKNGRNRIRICDQRFG